MTQDKLKERLAMIDTAEDFVRIFRETYPSYPGSPKSCANMLKGLALKWAQPEKHEKADQAIELCRQQFPGTSWYYAGD